MDDEKTKHLSVDFYTESIKTVNNFSNNLSYNHIDRCKQLSEYLLYGYNLHTSDNELFYVLERFICYSLKVEYFIRYGHHRKELWYKDFLQSKSKIINLNLNGCPIEKLENTLTKIFKENSKNLIGALCLILNSTSKIYFTRILQIVMQKKSSSCDLLITCRHNDIEYLLSFKKYFKGYVKFFSTQSHIVFITRI